MKKYREIIHGSKIYPLIKIFREREILKYLIEILIKYIKIISNRRINLFIIGILFDGISIFLYFINLIIIISESQRSPC